MAEWETARTHQEVLLYKLRGNKWKLCRLCPISMSEEEKYCLNFPTSERKCPWPALWSALWKSPFLSETLANGRQKTPSVQDYLFYVNLGTTYKGTFRTLICLLHFHMANSRPFTRIHKFCNLGVVVPMYLFHQDVNIVNQMQRRS